MITILIVGAAALAILFAIVWQERLDEREDYLSKWDAQLCEKANKLAQWESELIHWQRDADEYAGPQTDRP